MRRRPARSGAYQDGYLFGYGHDYAQGLADLRTLTGPSLLPPEWSFGTWFSKYQAYSTADYQNTLLPAFKSNKVPLDSLVIDTDWKAPNAWAGWNWNTSLFPDPESFLAGLKKQGVNTVVLLIHQGGQQTPGTDPNGCNNLQGDLVPIIDKLSAVPYAALQELVAWAEHADEDHPEPAEIAALPTKLRSELALARAEVRAKAAQAAPRG